MALIRLPAGRTLCGFEAVLAKVTATVDIDFIAGNIRASGNVGVSVGVDVASATIITSTSTVPAVSVAAYGVAIRMTDVVVIIIVGP
jgi:hypothetical protein